jgi:D-3-phosphoglycerate dehydrogenase / 2-oxoglutarate reductase
MRILVLGDSYCPASALAPAFEALSDHDVRYDDVNDAPGWIPTSDSERKIKEYLGSPAQVIDALGDAEVLVVQGAPLTEDVIAAGVSLRLICVARGGPVNVDVDAATARGIPVVTTPGKNATAVAELAFALMIMVARRIPAGWRHIEAAGEVFADNYEGAHWFGHELAGHTLGLIGFGQIGRRVARRANAFEMRVLAFDPFVAADDLGDARVQLVSLERLLGESDYVSLHARATVDNRGLMGRAQFGQMKPGAIFVNTARDVLVDEDALDDALRDGRLAGAALDIATPSPAGTQHRLLEHANVVLVPHIGGATHETLANGGHMAAAEIERFAGGLPLQNVANPEIVAAAEAPS